MSREEDAPFHLRFSHGEVVKQDGVPLREKVTVGRQPDNTVVLNHKTVSRHHATFLLDVEATPPAATLRDEGSTNGCVVNGRLLKGQSVHVRPGDAIQIGAFLVELLAEEEKGLDVTQDFADLEESIVFETSLERETALPDKRLQVLYDLTTRLTSLDDREVLRATAETIARCLAFDVLYLTLEHEGRYPIAFAMTPAGPSPPAQVPVSHSLIGRCLRDGVAILADNSNTQHVDMTSVLKSLSSALCVPLLSRDQRLGVFYASSSAEKAYTKEDLQLLIVAASEVTHKISNDRALQFVQAQKEKLETILASLREGVVLLDKDFRVVTANAAAEAIFKPADVIGKRLDDALAGFQHNLNLEALPALNTFQVQKAPAPGEARSAGLPRAPRVFSATLSRNTGVHDTSWMYALCLHDISQAHQLERMKSLFLNRLAHKICTPLTVVMATTSLVAKEAQGVLDSESKDLLQESMKHVEQCAALVRQFIEYTSLGLSDISSMKWARVSIEDLIEAALRSNAELIQRKQFRVVSLCPKGAVEIFGDREKLELVFHHLVQNAAKFGKTEGSLMIGPESKDRLVKVLFLDDGPGIPPGEMDNLGQLFYQVDPENTGEVPGAGFGLWLVRQIVQCHGGEVRLTSPANDEGGGTQVEVLVPGVMQAPKPFEGQTVDLAVTA